MVSIFNKNRHDNTLFKTIMTKSMKKSKRSPAASFSIDNSVTSSGTCSGVDTATAPPQTQTTIAGLIGDRAWPLLEGLLMDGAPLCIDDSSVVEQHAITENVVVHFALRFQAPLRTVSLLNKLYPSSIASQDASGRYPIHVACKWSATPDVITHLVHSNPSACGVQDFFGKTPMHYLAEFYTANYQYRLERLFPVDESMMQVVKHLKSAAPSSVNLEDNEGCNAIEYALENGVHIKVIKCMQRACRDDWRERSQGSDDVPRRRHSELLKDLQEISMNLREEMTKGGDDKELAFVHSVLTENNAASYRPRRRGSTVKISNGRVHVVEDPSDKSQTPITAAARSA